MSTIKTRHLKTQKTSHAKHKTDIPIGYTLVILTTKNLSEVQVCF